MTTGRVQDCGCIALPEELQAKTGLYPGATFDLHVAEDGSAVLLSSIERRTQPEFQQGASCGE